MNNNQPTRENLFLNTIRFQFPEEPQTFYFLHSTGREVFPFVTHHNKPIELEKAFPDFKNGDRYTQLLKLKLTDSHLSK